MTRREQYRLDCLKYRSVLIDRTTALPTFPLLFDALRTALDQRHRLGVLHIECVNLGIVESLYGWQVFDRILSHAANSLRESIGSDLPENSMLSMEGVAGARFVLFVLEQPDHAEVNSGYLKTVSRRICRRMDAAFSGPEFSGMSPELFFRVGQAMLSEDPFYRFERRVYGALDEAGRFNAQRERRREESWGEELQRIVREGAIDTVFQPVVDLNTRTIVGHEALARGPRDSLFEMPRAMFSLSSKIGIAQDLDRVCRDAALRASARLMQKGKLFINVLPGGMAASEQDATRLTELMRAASLERSDVVLEFSERCAEQDPQGFIASLEKARADGFGVALDDVGTGPGYRDLIDRGRPDFLKLDGSLVRHIESSMIKQEMLATVVGLADDIGATVIAEGVENQAEAETMARIGARYGQGYYFAAPAAPPLPAATPQAVITKTDLAKPE